MSRLSSWSRIFLFPPVHLHSHWLLRCVATLYGACSLCLRRLLALRLWLCRILALKSPDSRGLDQGPVFSLSSVLWLQWLLVPCSGFVGIWCLVTLSRWLLAPFSLYVLWLQWLLVLSMNSCRSQDLPGKSSIGALHLILNWFAQSQGVP